MAIGTIVKTAAKLGIKAATKAAKKAATKKPSRKGSVGSYMRAAKAQKTKAERAKNPLVRYAKDHGHDAKITNKGFKISDEPMDVYKGKKVKYKSMGKNPTLGRIRRHLGY